MATESKYKLRVKKEAMLGLGYTEKELPRLEKTYKKLTIRDFGKIHPDFEEIEGPRGEIAYIKRNQEFPENSRIVFEFPARLKTRERRSFSDIAGSILQQYLRIDTERIPKGEAFRRITYGKFRSWEIEYESSEGSLVTESVRVLGADRYKTKNDTPYSKRKIWLKRRYTAYINKKFNEYDAAEKVRLELMQLGNTNPKIFGSWGAVKHEPFNLTVDTILREVQSA